MQCFSWIWQFDKICLFFVLSWTIFRLNPFILFNWNKDKTVLQGLLTSFKPQIEPHQNSCRYPLINYLELDQDISFTPHAYISYCVCAITILFTINDFVLLMGLKKEQPIIMLIWLVIGGIHRVVRNSFDCFDIKLWHNRLRSFKFGDFCLKVNKFKESFDTWKWNIMPDQLKLLLNSDGFFKCFYVVKSTRFAVKNPHFLKFLSLAFWICLSKNQYKFVPPSLKLHNRYCHTFHKRS